MATACEKILREHFSHLDAECATYILGILSDASGEEMESADELYEAVGEMLLEVNGNKGKEKIYEICKLLYTTNKNSKSLHTSSSGSSLKALDTPFHFTSNSKVEVEENSNIWIEKKLQSMKVDSKKLEKAETKLKEKQDKRLNVEVKPRTDVVLESATASQQTNRKDAKLDASGTNRSYDIRIENFDVAFGERTLLSGADLLMSFGRRYGLIGRNGMGKTTLLRMMASRHLKIASHISVLHVEQEVVGDDTPAIESVLSCDTRRHKLLAEEKEITSKLQSVNGHTSDGDASGRLTEIYAELEKIDADKAPAKAAVILAGLGFSPSSQTRPTKEFSGGWRMRLALARALFSRPDLLLLDEPTNMLDMKAVIWLENYLQTWPSTILVVSHDREFLNSVASDILHLHSQRIDAYKGNYEDFCKTRDERLKNQQREYLAQKEYRDNIQVFIDRFRYNANRASQVQSKLKLLDKLPVLVPVEKETEVTFRFPEVEKLNPPILQLDEVTFSYSSERVIFKNVCLSPNMDSRICIVGENGAGKTTLLKVLLGELEPVSGIRHCHRNLRIGYFSQHHVDQMDLNISSVEVLASKIPGKSAEFYRNQLGSFGLSGELAVRPVASLSGGQKSRVAFALMSMLNPNFFILDEPTNHLDMETIEALSKALAKFKGGVMLVSHDERLIRMVCTEVWICGNQTVKSLDGGIDEYKKLVEQELAT